MSGSGRTLSCRVLASGRARGRALVLDEPLSFWGGLETATGEVIDKRHPQAGAVVTERVLVMPSGRGSSSSSNVLAEAIRRGTAPAAIVLREPDEIVVLGSLVANELYGKSCPVVVMDEASYGSIRPGDVVSVSDRQGVTVEPDPG